MFISEIKVIDPLFHLLRKNETFRVNITGAMRTTWPHNSVKVEKVTTFYKPSLVEWIETERYVYIKFKAGTLAVEMQSSKPHSGIYEVYMTNSVREHFFSQELDCDGNVKRTFSLPELIRIDTMEIL